MEENIQFMYVTRDGAEYPINVGGVQSIFEAADELRSSIVNGDLDIKLTDVIKIVDIPG